MNPSDRLTARSLLIDELYAAKSKAEYERDQLRSEVEDLKKKVSDSAAPNVEDASPGS